MRQFKPEEIAVPVATGIVSGVLYQIMTRGLVHRFGSEYIKSTTSQCLADVGHVAVMVAGIQMSKKFIFGLLHEKEKKRNAVDSVDTLSTVVAYLLPLKAW